MNKPKKVRYMRLLVFFDLPVKTAKQRKDYRQFRKFLLKDGYLQLQESVYVKLVVNDGVAGVAIARLRKNRPPAGLVQVMKVSEGAYATMECITGDVKDFDEVDTLEELLIL